MNYNPNIHHRRSIRLPKYNYSQVGAYFVTICTQHRLCLFGGIVDHTMILNVAGQMVEAVWSQLPHRFPQIVLDSFVVMPNHVHGIILITEGDNHNGIPSDCAIPESSPLGVCTRKAPTGRAFTRGAPTFAKIDGLVGVGLVSTPGLVPTLIPWGVQLSNLASTVVDVSHVQGNLCIDRNC